MKTIVFIFVPVQIDRQNPNGAFPPDTRSTLRKTRRILFSHRRSAFQGTPFWTWFMDNPRPPSATQK
jgi:hypothetical protein